MNEDLPLNKDQRREWDLNPRPRAYESPALPLSYLAEWIAAECYYAPLILSIASPLRFRHIR